MCHHGFLPCWIAVVLVGCLTPFTCRPLAGSLSLVQQYGPALPLPARERAWAPPLPLTFRSSPLAHHMAPAVESLSRSLPRVA